MFLCSVKFTLLLHIGGLPLGPVDGVVRPNDRRINLLSLLRNIYSWNYYKMQLAHPDPCIDHHTYLSIPRVSCSSVHSRGNRGK